MLFREPMGWNMLPMSDIIGVLKFQCSAASRWASTPQSASFDRAVARLLSLPTRPLISIESQPH
jgi:hypothetical protein